MKDSTRYLIAVFAKDHKMSSITRERWAHKLHADRQYHGHHKALRDYIGVDQAIRLALLKPVGDVLGVGRGKL